MKRYLTEVFIIIILGMFFEVCTTALLERISMGSNYILNSVPFISFQGHTTMWMISIGLILPLCLRFMFKVFRNFKIFSNTYFLAFVIMILIFISEFVGGLFFNKLLGFHLWDYSQYHIRNIPLHLYGQISIVYIPFWYIAGLVARPAYKCVNAIVPDINKDISKILGI